MAFICYKTKYRDLLSKYLTSKNIATMIHYPTPPHKQNAYKEWNNYYLPETEKNYIKKCFLFHYHQYYLMKRFNILQMH